MASAWKLTAEHVGESAELGVHVLGVGRATGRGERPGLRTPDVVDEGMDSGAAVPAHQHPGAVVGRQLCQRVG
jgi:hypothetical protein